MPNYMDELFRKVKEKKDGTQSVPETGKPQEQKKTAEQAKAQEKKPFERESQQAGKPLEKPLPEQQKKSEQQWQKPVQENFRQAQPQEKVKTVPQQERQKQEAFEELKKSVQEMKKAEAEKETGTGAKEIEEYTGTFSENSGEQKSEIEKELEHAQKKEIASYGETKIYKIEGQPLLYYWTNVPRPVGAEKTIINTIKEAATRVISITPYKIRDPEERRNVYFNKIIEILNDSPELKIPKTKFAFYADAVVREMVGYGVIDPLIKDDKLEEIMVIGANIPVYVFHREYEMMLSNIEFYSDNEVQDLINRIARQIGRRVDLSSPLLDARLPDGSRVNATIPPASVQGSTLTIRKFREDPYSIIDIINNGTLNTEFAAFLWLCMEGLGTRPANILIAGGTGSGKTTTLNVLASFIPANERIISIEDTAELNLPLKHWIRMEARPPGLEGTGELTMDILTKNALRMRPDRIIVGEIRHDEAFTLFTAFNTGHDGSTGTVHANSAQETIVRVTSPPMNVPQVMLTGLNFILLQHRLHDKKLGTIRRITEMAEISNISEGKAKAEIIYQRNVLKDSLERTRTPIKYMEMLQEMTGLSKKQVEEELREREEFLAKLVKQKKRDMKTVSKEMHEFLILKK